MTGLGVLTVVVLVGGAVGAVCTVHARAARRRAEQRRKEAEAASRRACVAAERSARKLDAFASSGAPQTVAGSPSAAKVAASSIYDGTPLLFPRLTEATDVDPELATMICKTFGSKEAEEMLRALRGMEGRLSSSTPAPAAKSSSAGTVR